MKSRAALGLEAGQPLVLDEIDVAGPKQEEVLVRIAATSVCHTDAYTLSGADPEGLFPSALGHESAGVVEDVGERVTSLQPGDHVIPLYTAECGDASSASRARPNSAVRSAPPRARASCRTGPPGFR